MEYGELTMEISDDLVKDIGNVFNIEIEMLQGNIELLPDGRKRFTLKVCQEKAELIKCFILQMMTKDVKKSNN